MKFEIGGHDTIENGAIEIRSDFRSAPNREPVDAVCASIPKRVRAMVSRVSYSDDDWRSSAGKVGYSIVINARFGSTGTTGAANETGLDRIRRAVKAIRTLGHTIECKEQYCQNAMTREYLEAAIPELITPAAYLGIR